jgi:ABC-2 type transport system ATP-binding protein
LKQRHQRSAEVIFAGEPPPGLDLIPGIEVLQRDGDRALIALEGGVNPLLRFLAGRDDVVDLLLSPPRLEDIFLGYYDASRGVEQARSRGDDSLFSTSASGNDLHDSSTSTAVRR